MKWQFTSESVTEGHPDKVCDQISDALLDELLQQDENARVAIETLVTTGSVHVAGEVTTTGYVDAQKVVRTVLKDIGYTNPKFGIDCEDAGVWVSLHGQSPDIAQGVDESNDKESGAGDEGLMFGYACKETPELMPLPIMLAHKLASKLAEVCKTNLIKGLGPDGKTQVTIEYEDSTPLRAQAIVIAQQHLAEISEESLKKEIYEKVIVPVVGSYLDDATKIHINATGKFVIGGPEGDSGLTGRKIIVDTYGGMARHGGGAFSGKDPSKVDRSAAYAARYIAKNIVAADLADTCEVQLSYAIGVAEPTSVYVNTFGTGKLSDEKLAEIVRTHFPLKPKDIINHLGLKKPIYYKTAAYGHFGKSTFSWEKTDKVELLKKEL